MTCDVEKEKKEESKKLASSQNAKGGREREITGKPGAENKKTLQRGFQKSLHSLRPEEACHCWQK